MPSSTALAGMTPTQRCGAASIAESNEISVAAQRAKLELAIDIAGELRGSV